MLGFEIATGQVKIRWSQLVREEHLRHGRVNVAGVEQLDEPGVPIDRTRDSWLDLAEIDLTNPVTWCRNNQIPVQPRQG